MKMTIVQMKWETLLKRHNNRKKSLLQLFCKLAAQKLDSDENPLINKHVCLVVSCVTNTLFPLLTRLMVQICKLFDL